MVNTNSELDLRDISLRISARGFEPLIITLITAVAPILSARLFALSRFSQSSRYDMRHPTLPDSASLPLLGPETGLPLRELQKKRRTGAHMRQCSIPLPYRRLSLLFAIQSQSDRTH